MANAKYYGTGRRKKSMREEYILYREQVKSRSTKEISTSIFGLETLKVVYSPSRSWQQEQQINSM